MDFHDKKSKPKKGKFEEDEAKHMRMEKLKSEKSSKKKKKGSDLTASLLSPAERGEPRSFFGDTRDSTATYNIRNSECGSEVSSNVNEKETMSSQPTVPEDYTWDFVIVLPVTLPELVEGDGQLVPQLEPSEVSHIDMCHS